ncbi:MAG: hypothetical protein WA705_12300 [Candidatus Ozemobacteraceae bacterium]
MNRESCVLSQSALYVQLALEQAITFHGIPSGKWRAFFQKPAAGRYTNFFTIVLDSMLSAGTIFPRNANDKMIELMAKNGLPM